MFDTINHNDDDDNDNDIDNNKGSNQQKNTGVFGNFS